MRASGGIKRGMAATEGRAMTIERLSNEQIANATTSLCDGGGLWLKVKKKKDGNYKRVWVFYYPHLSGERYKRKDGSLGEIKTREAGIGSAAKITAKAARKKAAQFREWISAEIDPISNRDKMAEQAGYTVSTALRKYDELVVARQSKQYQDSIKRHMRYIEVRIGHYHPSICTPPFLVKKLQFENITRGNRNHFWICLIGIFDIAQADCNLPSNPARKNSGIRKWVPKAEGEAISHGDRALPRERLWELMAHIRASTDGRGWDGLPSRTISSYLSEFVVVTGVRVSEVCEAKWGAIDEDKGKWDVPKTKNGLKRDVPITSSMAQVLRDVRAIVKAAGFPAGDNDPVFPKIEGKKTDGQPYTRGAIWGHLNRVCTENDLPPMPTHSLRTNFRGWGKSMVKHGCPHYPQLVEIQLAHKVIGKVAQAYSAQDDDWPERCEMMERYDKFCTAAPADNGNVVSFSKS
jgi:integrase